MREVPISDNPVALQFAQELLAGRVDAVLFLTGVGAEALREAVTAPELGEERVDAAMFLGALRRIKIIVRGPKPAAVLKKWEVPVAIRAPEPNTWEDVISAMRAAGTWQGQRIAVQEYGKPNEPLYAALHGLGCEVRAVPVYRWALPEDLKPLEAALRAAVAGEFDIFGFTSAQQIDNILTVAGQLGIADELRRAMNQATIASIGPTCSEALRNLGFEPGCEASPPKMGPFVRTAVATAIGSSGPGQPTDIP